MVALEPLGDRSFLARFGTEREASGWVAAVRSQSLAGVTDVVLSYRSAAVFADPNRVDLDALEAQLRSLEAAGEGRPEGRLVELPVLYDGPDLDEVAARLGLVAADVTLLHARPVYHVFAIGFLPGFPYAGYLDPALTGLPRRDQPRLRVAAGSVAIAGRQTGIYPCESPGGWHVLGRTPLRIADLDEAYFPIRAGDRIKFQPITPSEYEGRRDQRL